MKTIELIKSLETLTGTNDKIALVKQAFESGNREFFIGARLAYDKLISFGVKKVPAISLEVDDVDDGTLTFEHFIMLTQRLRSREITGHEARDAIAAAAERSGPMWNYFYRRILLRDLKVRVTESTINKVLESIGTKEALEYKIPVFQCQLAEDSKKHQKKLTGKKLIDVKLDGARMLTVLNKESGTVTMFTRNGIETDRFPHIRQSLEKMIPEIPFSLVLDGEILSDTFQNLMSQFQRKDAKTDEMKLGLFDAIPLDDFKKGECKLPQDERHEMLCEFQTSGLLRKYAGDKVYVIPKLSVDLSTEEGRQQMKEFFDQAVEAGFEGIMIKDPKARYRGKKWSAWLKWKPTISVTLKVVGIEQGGVDSEFAETLGALVCMGVDDVDKLTGITISSNVGSGFSIEQRNAWWANPSSIVGYMVEVEADAVSLNQNSTIYSLRFPRFKGYRGTIPDEKI